MVIFSFLSFFILTTLYHFGGLQCRQPCIARVYTSTNNSEIFILVYGHFFISP